MSDFEYTYSAPEQEELRKLRAKYLPPEENKLERLRRLDASVTRKGTVVGLVVGVLSCLVFGIGMCCCLVWAEQLFVLGVVVGVIGMAGMGMAYPLCDRITRRERERIAPEILRLTEELMK